MQVLYVGDHIYGDILRSKKVLGISINPFNYSVIKVLVDKCGYDCRRGNNNNW